MLYTYNDDLMCILDIIRISPQCVGRSRSLSKLQALSLFALDEFVTVGRGLQCQGGRVLTHSHT